MIPECKTEPSGPELCLDNKESFSSIEQNNNHDEVIELCALESKIPIFNKRVRVLELSESYHEDATELCESECHISKRDEHVVLQFENTKRLSVSKKTLLKLHKRLKKKCPIGSFVTAAVFESFDQGDVIVKEIGVPALADNLRRYYEFWDKKQSFENFEFIVPANLDVELALQFLKKLEDFFLIPFRVHEVRMTASRRGHVFYEKELFFEDKEVLGWTNVRILGQSHMKEDWDSYGYDETENNGIIYKINDSAQPFLRFESISLKWQVVRRQKVKSEVARLGHELIATFSDSIFMNGREGLKVSYDVAASCKLDRMCLRQPRWVLALVVVQQLGAASIFNTSFGRGEMLRYLKQKLNPDLFIARWHFESGLKSKRGRYEYGCHFPLSETEINEGYTSEEVTHLNDLPVPNPTYRNSDKRLSPFMLVIRSKKSKDPMDPFPKSRLFPDSRKKRMLKYHWNYQKLFCNIDKNDITLYLQIVKIISFSAAAWAVIYKIFFVIEI